MPGSIHIDHFTTLDGVAQAPGGPQEDPSGGFTFGGWQAPLGDEATGAQIFAGIDATDALLLGRRTYDIFAAYWPNQKEGPGPDFSIARRYNAIPKFVASRSRPDLSWSGSQLLGPDLAAEIASLRDRFEQVHVVGSIDFSRTLVAEGLFDQLNLWVYPIVVGRGKRLFPDDGPPTALELLSAEPASPNGTVLLRYGPTGGLPETGDMT
ncbi:deaminase [Subtercola boreus]|uniref:Deaminase n=1 Tax=Subtercola boreus TaxID=120213 RepID=A0A3E0VE23_9MICO|nr:dihydrofolate reductase family protein [Subtercola boreus]RFA07905.1 deaminase [Subtercola boreus]TQL55237.1 dihydrofolate reductase [Subtercola boreus]